MAYEGLLTVTLKVDDSHGRYRTFQKNLVEYSNQMLKNESEVILFCFYFLLG
jgi:hypothetical protein